LPSLENLTVDGNKQLGGMIDASFLFKSQDFGIEGCPLQLPFLSGVSLSSFNILGIFELAPKAVMDPNRAQGKTPFLYPMGSPKNTGTKDEQDLMDRQFRKYTSHLQGLWREQSAEGISYKKWLVEHCSKWCLWQETWLSELRQRWYMKGCLFVFVTPEKGVKFNWGFAGTQSCSADEMGEIELINKQSFETKFKSKMYTEGKIDDREWSSSKGSFMSGRAWCKEQCFDPTLGFADKGWGFDEGEKASGILDWERRHLASVSKKHGLLAVFISTAFVPSSLQGRANEVMRQVARPSWYPYDGLEAPLGTYVYTGIDTNGNSVDRMVCVEEANSQAILEEANAALVQVDGVAFGELCGGFQVMARVYHPEVSWEEY
jgi:hypothetical protein